MRVINAISPNPQIEGAIEELELALEDSGLTPVAGDGAEQPCKHKYLSSPFCIKCGARYEPPRA
jgi:hypothetical protein